MSFPFSPCVHVADAHLGYLKRRGQLSNILHARVTACEGPGHVLIKRKLMVSCRDVNVDFKGYILLMLQVARKPYGRG